MILPEYHDGVEGGHYASKLMENKILRASLWWPTLHLDASEYCKKCDVFQSMGNPYRRDEMPLLP